MPKSRIGLVPGIAALALVLTGCVPNAGTDGAGEAITVSSTETECTVGAAEATAGTLTFNVTNDGDRVTEFYLLADDGLRIVGEVENIAPGTERTLTVTAQPGSYFTACKPGMIGENVGQTEFTVSGERVELTGDEAEQQQTAIDNYKAYVRDQVSQLVPAAEEFVAAYVAGDDETARDLFASTRVYYERIEPTAEAFGDLDPKIDYREVDAREEGLDWTGFHRIEKDLWPPADGDLNSDDTDALDGWAPSTDAERQELGDQLLADIGELNDLVTSDDFELQLGDISNGAIGLLDEVATGKITGEEDWWSGTDLTDFQANVEGAEVAYGIVRDMALAQGDEGEQLVADIDAGFEELNAELAEYGSIDEGFTNYQDLTDEQIKGLSDKVSALAEPLSQLTALLLG
jgi:iron uptake system component EfeO